MSISGRGELETMAEGERIQNGGGQRHDRIIEDSNTGVEIEEQEVPISITQKMLSATSGSILTSLLVTPLDVVRVRLQSQHHHTPAPKNPLTSHVQSSLSSFSKLPSDLGISTCCREVFWVNNNATYCVASPNISVITNPTATSSLAECAAEESQKKAYTSTLDGLRKIARNEGPRTLWRGLSPTLAMAVPGNVIYFAGYDWLRTSNRSPMGPHVLSADYAPLIAGSTARVLAAIAVSPIEMFRTRMQAAHSATTVGHFRETVDGMTQMVADKGVRSLWTGLTLTLWRDVPFSAIYWWGYEYGRNKLQDLREESRGRDRGRFRGPGGHRSRSASRSNENHTATLVDSFVAGASSGAVAAFVTTPFDVGKTKQQVMQHAKSSNGAADGAAAAVRSEEKSMPRFLLDIYRQQGMQGLFRGWAARCLKVAPACAIMISSYEVGKKMAGVSNERKERKREAKE